MKIPHTFKVYISILMYYLPKFIKDPIIKRQSEKRMSIQLEHAQKFRITKEESKELIDLLPLGDCDVLLHTSMVNIGKIQGGKKWLADNLINVINTSKNTLLTTAAQSLERNSTYLKKHPIFDVRTAPVGMGSVNEYIAQLPNARRSIHPTHSVVAIGKDADFYIKDQEKDPTAFCENSPYYKIIKKRGKLLMFGATMESITLIHAIEDMLGDDYPYKIYNKQRLNIECVDSNGKHIFVITPTHAPILGLRRKLSWMKYGLKSQGYLQEWNLGGGKILLIDIYGFTMFYLNELLSGKSIYGKFNCSDRLRNRIEKIKKEL